MGENKEKLRRHICFYGRVQGVGFRYTAMQLAQSLGLTGWVRNVEDFVEMEVQGDAASIGRLLEGLEKNRWIYIERMETAELSLKEERQFSLEW